MASNEELVMQIKAGDESKLLELWEQVKRLAYKRALRVVRALGDDRAADIDDLMQAAFLAVVDAVEQYDPASGWAFSTVYVKRLKTAFGSATGWQTAAGRNDPMRHADSLDRPLDATDSASETLGDLVADPLDQMEAVEERDFLRWRNAMLQKAMNCLAPEQVKVIQLRYRERCTIAETAAKMGYSMSEARRAEMLGLAKLRRQPEIRVLLANLRT